MLFRSQTFNSHDAVTKGRAQLSRPVSNGAGSYAQGGILIDVGCADGSTGSWNNYKKGDPIAEVKDRLNLTVNKCDCDLLSPYNCTHAYINFVTPRLAAATGVPVTKTVILWLGDMEYHMPSEDIGKMIANWDRYVKSWSRRYNTPVSLVVLSLKASVAPIGTYYQVDDLIQFSGREYDPENGCKPTGRLVSGCYSSSVVDYRTDYNDISWWLTGHKWLRGVKKYLIQSRFSDKFAMGVWSLKLVDTKNEAERGTPMSGQIKKGGSCAVIKGSTDGEIKVAFWDKIFMDKMSKVYAHRDMVKEFYCTTKNNSPSNYIEMAGADWSTVFSFEVERMLSRSTMVESVDDWAIKKGISSSINVPIALYGPFTGTATILRRIQGSFLIFVALWFMLYFVHLASMNMIWTSASYSAKYYDYPLYQGGQVALTYEDVEFFDSVAECYRRVGSPIEEERDLTLERCSAIMESFDVWMQDAYKDVPSKFKKSANRGTNEKNFLQEMIENFHTLTVVNVYIAPVIEESIKYALIYKTGFGPIAPLAFGIIETSIRAHDIATAVELISSLVPLHSGFTLLPYYLLPYPYNIIVSIGVHAAWNLRATAINLYQILVDFDDWNAFYEYLGIPFVYEGISVQIWEPTFATVKPSFYNAELGMAMDAYQNVYVCIPFNFLSEERIPLDLYIADKRKIEPIRILKPMNFTKHPKLLLDSTSFGWKVLKFKKAFFDAFDADLKFVGSEYDWKELSANIEFLNAGLEVGTGSVLEMMKQLSNVQTELMARMYQQKKVIWSYYYPEDEKVDTNEKVDTKTVCESDNEFEVLFREKSLSRGHHCYQRAIELDDSVELPRVIAVKQEVPIFMCVLSGKEKFCYQSVWYPSDFLRSVKPKKIIQENVKVVKMMKETNEELMDMEEDLQERISDYQSAKSAYLNILNLVQNQIVEQLDVEVSSAIHYNPDVILSLAKKVKMPSNSMVDLRRAPLDTLVSLEIGCGRGKRSANPICYQYKKFRKGSKGPVTTFGAFNLTIPAFLKNCIPESMKNWPLASVLSGLDRIHAAIGWNDYLEYCGRSTEPEQCFYEWMASVGRDHYDYYDAIKVRVDEYVERSREAQRKAVVFWCVLTLIVTCLGVMLVKFVLPAFVKQFSKTPQRVLDENDDLRLAKRARKLDDEDGEVFNDTKNYLSQFKEDSSDEDVDDENEQSDRDDDDNYDDNGYSNPFIGEDDEDFKYPSSSSVKDGRQRRSEAIERTDSVSTIDTIGSDYSYHSERD